MDTIRAGDVLTNACFTAALNAGWHSDPETQTIRTIAQNKTLFPVRIALCHSELSEALEGDRKNLMDDHLPHRSMAEVELADAVIRIFDLAGCMGFDLGNAITEKLAYNKQRADHTLSARQAVGGKVY